MNVLIIGNDPTIFDEKSGGDTRQRHIDYARLLNKEDPGSKINFISFTHRRSGLRPYKSGDLYIVPANSFHRIFFFFDILRIANTLLKQESFDLITTQTPFDDGLAGYLLSRKFNAKFIPQLHFDLFSPWWLRESFINRLKKIVGGIVLKAGDGIRVVNETLKSRVRSFTHNDNIFSIPVSAGFNALSLSQSEKAEMKMQILPHIQDSKIVLFVGSLYFPKNLHAFIRVAERVSRVRKDTVFLIAGDGKERQDLERHVKESALSGIVLFLGSRRYEDLPPLFGVSDVFFLPSKYEGFGRVIVEAFLSKLPVVTTKTSGATDIVRDGESGFLIDVSDEEAMAEKILYLLDNPETARRFGENGRKFVSERFNRERLMKELVTAWIKVAKN